MHNHDNHILELMMIGVSACYFIIAIQFFITLKTVWGKVDKRSAVSLALLVLVFTFCGLAGYAFATKTA